MKKTDPALAPIALFAYNRPVHLKKTIQALGNNSLASKSIIFAFIDGPKDEYIKENECVKNILSNLKGFKKIHVIERGVNIGLRKNIIEGIDYVFKKYNKIIVVEDDIITSKHFLDYMNQSLNYYENKDKVWHISGYNDPIDLRYMKDDVYFWRGMNCWGWGTWKNKWQHFEKNPTLLKEKFNKQMIKRFNIENTQELWSQVEENYLGKIDTWAVFWYATIFINKGLSLFPKLSYVNNIGFDGSGENCKNTNVIPNIKLNENKRIKFSDEIKEQEINVKNLIHYYRKIKKNILSRIFIKLTKIFN